MIAFMGIVLSGCQPAEIYPNQGSAAAVERGRLAAESLGCGACHAMPGIDWPQGRVGPDLAGFGNRAMIAGQLPNRPENLAAFVRNAPAFAPGTAMPAIPMTPSQSQDIAIWLQSLK